MVNIDITKEGEVIDNDAEVKSIVEGMVSSVEKAGDTTSNTTKTEDVPEGKCNFI